MRVCSSNGDIVNETEPGRSVFPAVVSWWADRDKSAFDGILVIYDSINGFAYCPKCTLDRVDRFGTYWLHPSGRNQLSEKKQLTVQVALR